MTSDASHRRTDAHRTLPRPCPVVSRTQPPGTAEATIHDALFKALASSPEVAADILRPLLDPAVAAAIDWSTLELLPGEFVDDTLRTTRADLVFRVRIHGREGFVFALLEHQSTADALMPFRVLVYIVGIWRAWLKDQSDAGVTVSRLPPVIPVVVHNGLRPWSVPVDLADVIDLPPELAALRPYLPDLTLLLDDLAATDDDRIEAQHHVALTIATLLALKYGHGDIDPVVDRLGHHIGLASAQPGGWRGHPPRSVLSRRADREPRVDPAPARAAPA